jgi:hypothetical protein
MLFRSLLCVAALAWVALAAQKDERSGDTMDIARRGLLVKPGKAEMTQTGDLDADTMRFCSAFVKPVRSRSPYPGGRVRLDYDSEK